MSTPQTLLAGLKIVSMAEQFPGPYATMLLADMGAEVILVERPGIGDPSRFLPPFFEGLNRGKRAVALNIKDKADYEALIGLIKEADVFLEGFRPGKLEKAGLGYDALSVINPRLIYASISGYGQGGPYRDRPGHDLSYQGVGGALFETLREANDTQPSSLLLGDLGSAMFATIGILAALEGRHRTGKGTYIDVAMADCVAALMAAPIVMALNGGASLEGPAAEPAYDVFCCSDGRWMTLSIAHEDDFWQRLTDALDLPEHKSLRRYERTARRQEIKAVIASRIATKSYGDWEPIMVAYDQMFGPAYDRADVINDPHLQARGVFETLMRADRSEQIVVRQPLKFTGFTNAQLTPSPAVGADNAALLSKYRSYETEERHD
jgi:crotonobetainyl-CoA:carnitine CoA-transferase CaiB-like acyl-CoA transferase